MVEVERKEDESLKELNTEKGGRLRRDDIKKVAEREEKRRESRGESE
jgi:hypothetical protein